MAEEPVTTVSYVEWANSPTDGFRDNNQFWARRVLRCAWDDRIQLMRELNGGYRDDETGTWRLPMTYPWNENARVLNCSAKPYPPPPSGSDAAFDDGATHPYALVTVNYNVRQISTQTGEGETRLREYQFSSNAEFLTRSVKDKDQQPTLWWTAPNEVVNREDAPNVLLIGTQMVLEIFEVDTLSSHIDDWAGAINHTAIDSAYLPSGHPGFPRWTFRYDGANYGITFTSEGAERWNVQLMFTHRANSWNRFYRPGQVASEYMYTSATGRAGSDQYLPYPHRELNTLISDML